MVDYLGTSRTIDRLSTAGGVRAIGALIDVTPSPPPDPPDVTPPTIDGLIPAPSTPIGAFQSIQFDVADDTALAGVFVFAVFANRATEVIHDGSAFGFGYSASSRNAIPGGFHFTIRRTGGWPSAPTLRVRALDTRGNAS